MPSSIKVLKMNSNASLPEKGSAHAVGWDIRAELSRLAEEAYESSPKKISFEKFLNNFCFELPPHQCRIIPSGLKFELPLDVEMAMKSRSGLFSRQNLFATGTIDPDYRGEVGVMIINLGQKSAFIKHKERIAQAVFRKVINHDENMIEVLNEEELSESIRSTAGFGSTGKH